MPVVASTGHTQKKMLTRTSLVQNHLFYLGRTHLKSAMRATSLSEESFDGVGDTAIDVSMANTKKDMVTAVWDFLFFFLDLIQNIDSRVPPVSVRASCVRVMAG